MRDKIFSVAATVVLLLGFVDLARGGVTLAPILFVAGYLILVPMSLWGAPRRDLSRAVPKRRISEGPSYRAAALISLGTLVLYLLTLAPSTAMWDTSEYMTAAYTLGLPHPPGNPLFVLLGRFFSILPIASSVAVRINILAALCSAVAAGMWFLVTETVLAGWLTERWQRLAGATLGSIIGATAFTVWNQSVVNEKVYTVSLVGIAIISWLMIRWSDDPDGPKADRLLLMVAYLCGLGYANHMAGMLAAPAVTTAVLVRRPRTLLRWRLVVACVAALVLGLTPFATQPIRSAYFPPLNEGEPTGCRTHIALSCTFSRETYRAFMYNFNREQYGKPQLADRQAPFSAQMGMWWLYFKWQWFRDAYGDHATLQSVLAALFLVLGLFGAWVHWRRDRRSFWYFATYMVTVSLVLVYYLNFKYGASQAPELGDAVAREVRDRDYFFIWSFSPWGVWAALGLVMIWESVGGLTRNGRGMLLAAPMLVVAFVPLVANWHQASRRGDRTTLAFAHDLLDSVEPYGVLVTYGDNDTFPLWYAQEVEGIRKDVTVAVLSLLNTDWYVRGIIRRPIYEYDAARGPAVYRGRSWPKPTGSPMHLTLDEADSIPDYVLVRQPMVLHKAGLTATVAPQNLPQMGDGSGILERKDIAVLRMIADSWPERPIYFSRTVGSYAQSLGLGGFTLSQGLASKLFLPPATASRDTVEIRGSGWFDLPRSKALFMNVFEGPGAIEAHGDWVDRPSVSIPLTYIFAAEELAAVLRAQGEAASAGGVLDTASRIAHTVHEDATYAAIHSAWQSAAPE
jgi:hypothetical protein